MRLVSAILALSLAAWPAVAQQPQPKQKAAPAAQGPAQVYAAMTAAERVAIQNDLIWSGDFNGTATGSFEARSIEAVKAFQKRNGGKDTGILNPQERVALATASKKAQDSVGWRIVTDTVTGARVGLPGRHTPQTSPTKTGTRWTSQRGQVVVETFRETIPGTTLASVFEAQKKDPSDRKVEYSVIRPDFFVLSGLQGLKKFYVRGGFKNNEVRGVSILYDQSMDGVMEPVVVAMSSAFAPFPTAVVAAAPTGPPPKRKVEYGTGVIVSAAGHIVADRQVTDGCSAVVIAGYGDAERVAEDKTAELVLLRINGAGDLAPLPLATGAASGDVTLLGIADPQAQNGGAAVSRTTAKLNGEAVAPVPPYGFAGAVAIDNQRRVTGLVTLKPQMIAGPPVSYGTQAVLVPSDAIRKFVTANKAQLTSTPPADANASLVRVICVRK